MNSINYYVKHNVNIGKTSPVKITSRLSSDVMITFVIILLGTALLYYTRDSIIRSLYYIVLFTLYLFSKDDVFWVALFFLMSASIFGMFALTPFRWIFVLTSSVGVNWDTILPFVIYAKIYKYNKSRAPKIRDLLKNKYVLFKYYLLFLVLWGAVHGYSAAVILMIWNSLTGYVLFTCLTNAYPYDKLLKFSKLVFAITIILFIISVFELIFGNLITNLLHAGVRKVIQTTIQGEELTRQFIGTTIFYYSLLMSLFYIANKRKDFNAIYLVVVATISALSILNTATRGWMIATIVLMVLFMFTYARRVLTMLFVPKILSLMILIVLLGYLFIPKQLTNNLSAAFRRLSTLEVIYTEGDMTAGGTSGRWDIRGPEVLTRFKESPIIGFGFSRVTWDYYDGHVGNHSLLLHGGIFGLIIVYLTVMTLIIYFIKKDFTEARGVGVFGLALISMMIIHSTSRQMISFRMSTEIIFLICMLFANYNAYMHLLKSNRDIYE